MKNLVFAAILIFITPDRLPAQSCYQKSVKAVLEDFKKKDFKTALIRIENIQKNCIDIPERNDLNLLKQQAQAKVDSVRFVKFVPVALVRQLNLQQPGDSLKLIAIVPLGADKKGIRRFGVVYSYIKDSLKPGHSIDSLKQQMQAKWLTISVWETAADSFLLVTMDTPNVYAATVPNQAGPFRFKKFDFKTSVFIFHDERYSLLRYRYFQDTKSIKQIQKQYLVIEDF